MTPRQSGFWISNTLDHAEGIPIVFCRKLKVSEASTRRLRWTNDVEACVTTRVEARSRRWCPSHQLKVAAPVRHAVALHCLAKSGAVM
jgi:hypothetical protein